MTIFSFLIPCLISLTFMPTFLINAKNIVAEKETKMKEYLKLVGVKPVVIWICLVLRSMIVYFLLSIILTCVLVRVILVNSYNDSQIDRQFLVNTSWGIVFLVLIMFSIQTTLLSILVGHVFSKCKLRLIKLLK
jgi:hypothetical protein